MCKEMSVILVDRVVDKKRIIGKWRAEEEKRQKGLLTPPPQKKNILLYLQDIICKTKNIFKYFSEIKINWCSINYVPMYVRRCLDFYVQSKNNLEKLIGVESIMCADV
jgi:hypothetical protein